MNDAEGEAIYRAQFDSEEEMLAYEAWQAECEAEYERRGPLAGSPEEIGCYACAGFDGSDGPMRKVVKLGPIVNRQDPTKSYVLECGHTII